MALFEDDTVEVQPRSELCQDDVNVDLNFTQLFSLRLDLDSDWTEHPLYRYRQGISWTFSWGLVTFVV